MNLPPPVGDLATLDRVQCLSLLADAPFARIAFVAEHGPTILPINHLLLDDAVYFRTSPGSKLAMAAGGKQVAIEVDGSDPTTRTAWSVVAHGRASLVTDEGLTQRLHALPFEPWVFPDDRSFWVEITIDDVAGRRIVPEDLA